MSNLNPLCFSSILRRNGWNYKGTYSKDDPDDMSVYTMHIEDYCCYAEITEHEKQLGCMGHYGVAWVDVFADHKPPYDKNDLQRMADAIEGAEDNLLLIGIPFCPDHQFSGSDTAKKQQRNNELRKAFHLDEMEEKWNEPNPMTSSNKEDKTSQDNYMPFAIVEAFENLLERKGITIPCADSTEEEERKDSDARIYGAEYGDLITEISEILK